MERRVAHLPGMAGDPHGRHRGQTPAGEPFSAPALTAEAAREVAAAVRSAALASRRERDLDAVVRSVSRAAGRLAEPGVPVGEEALSLLVDELGWDADLARRTLVGMAATWTEASLRRVLQAELGDPAALERFVPGAPPSGQGVGGKVGARPPGASGSRRRRALGPPLLFVVHAGNVPGVAVTAAVRGLLVRSGVLSKASSGEPGLLALFARALAEEDELLGRCLATTWWPGGTAPPVEEAWVKSSGKVVVYGGGSAVDSYRGRVPAHVDLVAYGPRVGLAVVLPDADPGVAARSLARDVFAYEQGGCVSPRIVYAVGRPAAELAEPIAAALAEEASGRQPPPPDAAEATAIRALRAEAEFAGYGGTGQPGTEPSAAREPVQLLASQGDLAWTVLAGGDATPRSEALPRVVRVHGVDDLERLAALLAPLEGRIQALGAAGSEGAEELAERAAELGVARIAPLGAMAWPPADWRHDGRHQLLPLLRWTDWET